MYNAGNATIIDSQGLGTITDDDPTPILSITPWTLAVGTVTEGNDATFQINLDRPSSQDVSVNYSTEAAGATAGDDFTATSGTLIFTAGQTSKNVVVSTIDDTLHEADEFIDLKLSNLSNATLHPAYHTGRYRISDNDPIPAISISGDTVPKGTQPAAIR